MTAPPAPPTPPAPDVIPYASPPALRSRVTFRGAVATLIVGGGLLLLTVVLVLIAWSVFRNYTEVRGRGGGSDVLEVLGVFVCVLAGLSFVAGIVVTLMGLSGVRQRELA